MQMHSIRVVALVLDFGLGNGVSEWSKLVSMEDHLAFWWRLCNVDGFETRSICRLAVLV